MAKRILSWSAIEENGRQQGWELTINGHTHQYDAANLDSDMRHLLMLHGMKQKLADSGNVGTEEEREFAIMGVWENLLDGNWTVRGQGDGAILVQALAALTGTPAADVAERLKDLDEGAKKALLKRKDVKREITRIRLARLEDADEDEPLAF